MLAPVHVIGRGGGARALAAGVVGVALLVAGCSSSSHPVAPSTPPSPSTSLTNRPAVPIPATSSRSASAPPTPPVAPHTTTGPATAHVSPTPPAARGRVVVLNPGHNGGNAAHAAEIAPLVPAGYGRRKACDTTGTETDAGYPEHAFAWDLAGRIRTILQQHGVRVVLTRHNDHSVGPCVDRRAEIGNHADVAAVVTLHADGGPADGRGFHVNQDSLRPDGASAAVAHESDQLGRAIHRTLVQTSGLVPSTYIGQDGYVYRTDFAGLDLATRPATFLELGNMRNSADAAKLSSASGRQRIAVAVADGILAFLAAH